MTATDPQRPLDTLDAPAASDEEDDEVRAARRVYDLALTRVRTAMVLGTVESPAFHAACQELRTAARDLRAAARRAQRARGRPAPVVVPPRDSGAGWPPSA